MCYSQLLLEECLFVILSLPIVGHETTSYSRTTFEFALFRIFEFKKTMGQVNLLKNG